MEQQNSNPNTTPQDQQQKCPYNLRTNSNFYPMPAGVYDRRTGRYMNEDQQIFHIMLDDRVLLDLIEDTPATLKKWSIKSPLESESIDAVFMLLKRAELPKEIQGKVNGIFETYKEINQTYQTLQTKYKEAAALLHDQPLQNKELIQIITLYYFATCDIEVVEPAPLTDEQRAELIATAQEMDQVYTDNPGKNQEHYLAPDYANIPQEFTEAREFFAYFPFVSFYCCYKEFSDLPLDETADHIPEPQQILLPSIPDIPAINPNYSIMINSRLMYDLVTNARINAPDPEYDLYNYNCRGNKEITSYVAITYDPDPNSGIKVTGPEKLSGYERTIYDAIVSLFATAAQNNIEKPTVTVDMIYRAMPGSGDKPSRGQKAAIVRVMNKFGDLHIEIDATADLRARGKIGPKETRLLKGKGLLFTELSGKVQNGRTVHAYKIAEEPILYTHSKLINQLCTIHVKYLALKQVEKGVITDKPIRMSPEKQVITHYVLRRIAIMKRDERNTKQNNDAQNIATQNKKRTRRSKPRNEMQKQSRTILFSSILDIAGLTNLTGPKKKAYRDFVYAMLDYETAAGYIKGYKKQRENNWEIKGVEIIL